MLRRGESCMHGQQALVCYNLTVYVNKIVTTWTILCYQH